MERLDELVAFMKLRHSIYVARAGGEPWPWVDDPILQQYRFCNVYRELDTVTVWVRERIREPFATHPMLWFMLAIARQINLPETLAELMADKKGAWPTGTKWEPTRLRDIIRDRQARGEQAYTSAYMLTCNWGPEHKGDRDKASFTAFKVLEPLWARAHLYETLYLNAGTLAAAHKGLLSMEATGWGGFTAYEVVSDLRWTRYLERAPDINTFAHAGPGAQRGLNRLHNRDVFFRKDKPGTWHDKTGLTPAKALEEMRTLLPLVREKWPRPSKLWPRLELREIEHSLCEFDKYERVRLGEGKPRSRYSPKPHQPRS